MALLYDTVSDENCVAAGSAAGAARRIWTVGFGASRGAAEALALLLHEKAQLPAVAASPSGFRHGLVEASSAADSLVVIECRDEDPPLTSYFDRLAIEGQRVGLKIVADSAGPRRSEHSIARIEPSGACARSCGPGTAIGPCCGARRRHVRGRISGVARDRGP